jgi:hypothetical protein
VADFYAARSGLIPSLPRPTFSPAFSKGSLPSLLEPDLWTGKANAAALEPLRKKRAEIHRGSRRRDIGPLKEAGYTSAMRSPNQNQPDRCNQAGSIYIHK